MEHKTKPVTLPTSKLRTLTTKDSMSIYPPTAKYITNGHLAVLTRLWPDKGRKEQNLYKEPRKRCRSLSRRIDGMIDEVPDDKQPELVPTRAVLAHKGGPIIDVVFTDSPRPLGFNARYYRWITATLGLHIHDRAENRKLKPFANLHPYPIKDAKGKIAGMIMPVNAVLSGKQVMVDLI